MYSLESYRYLLNYVMMQVVVSFCVNDKDLIGIVSTLAVDDMAIQEPRASTIIIVVVSEPEVLEATNWFDSIINIIRTTDRICINWICQLMISHISNISTCCRIFKDNTVVCIWCFWLQHDTMLESNRKWQDYVYIQCEYKSTKQK